MPSLILLLLKLFKVENFYYLQTVSVIVFKCVRKVVGYKKVLDTLPSRILIPEI